jgi:predicted aminopeptidase
MVDSRTEKRMTNASGNLPERVQRVEQKLDALRASMDAGFEHVDAALLEQREYTEFAYEKLDAKMDAGFSRLDRQMDAGFSRLDQRMDAAFAQIDGRFTGLERKMDGRFARLERKIDQIVDLHLPKTPPDRSDSE